MISLGRGDALSVLYGLRVCVCVCVLWDGELQVQVRVRIVRVIRGSMGRTTESRGRWRGTRGTAALCNCVCLALTRKSHSFS